MNATQISKNKMAFKRMSPTGFRQSEARSPGIVVLPTGEKVRVRSRHRAFVTPAGQVTTNPMVASGKAKYVTVVLPATQGDQAPANVGVNGMWVKLSPGGGMGILHRGKRRDPVSVLQVKQGPFGTVRAKVRYLKHDRRGEGHSGNPGSRTRRTVSTAGRFGLARLPGAGLVTMRTNPPATKDVRAAVAGRGIGQVLRDLGSGKARLKLSRSRGLEIVER